MDMPLAVELWGSCLSWCVSPDNAHDYACISRSMCSVLRSATIWRGTVADTRNVPVTQLEPPARWPFGQCKAIIASAPAVVSLSRYGVPVYLGWQGHFPGHLLHDAWAPLRPGVNYFMSDTDLLVRDVPVTVTVQAKLVDRCTVWIHDGRCHDGTRPRSNWTPKFPHIHRNFHCTSSARRCFHSARSNAPNHI